MTRFYANENLTLDLVRELRQLGYDVLTSIDAGQANQSILLCIERAKSIAVSLSVKKIGIIFDKPTKFTNLF